jgi:hypothetical protein
VFEPLTSCEDLDSNQSVFKRCGRHYCCPPKRPRGSRSHKRKTRKSEDSELPDIDVSTVGTWEQTCVWQCAPGICCVPDLKLWSGFCCSIDELKVTKAKDETNTATARTEGIDTLKKIIGNQTISNSVFPLDKSSNLHKCTCDALSQSLLHAKIRLTGHSQKSNSFNPFFFFFYSTAESMKVPSLYFEYVDKLHSSPVKISWTIDVQTKTKLAS